MRSYLVIDKSVNKSFDNSRNVKSSANLHRGQSLRGSSTNDETEAFIHRLREQKRKLKEKRLRRWQKQKAKIQKEMEEQEKLQRERQEAKHKELVKRREEIETKLKQKKDMHHSRNLSAKKKSPSARTSVAKPLYHKLETEYKEKIVLPELDRSKEVLKRRKEYMKRVEHSELVEHEQKYLTDLEKLTIKLKQDRKSNITVHQSNLNKYKSKLIDKIRERDILESQREMEKKQERSKINEKMVVYAKVAQEAFWPHVSEKKKQEMKSIIDSLKK